MRETCFTAAKIAGVNRRCGNGENEKCATIRAVKYVKRVRRTSKMTREEFEKMVRSLDVEALGVLDGEIDGFNPGFE